jgi:hypothetical protein
MNVSGLTDQSLQDLHSLIAECLVADDALPTDQKKWGVRKYSDWRRQADAFEEEMKKRRLEFTPIEWDHP